MTTDIAAQSRTEMNETQDVAAAAPRAFDQWYVSEGRLERYYIESCSAYLDNKDRAKILPGYARLPNTDLLSLCVLPGGEKYECEPGDNLRK